MRMKVFEMNGVDSVIAKDIDQAKQHMVKLFGPAVEGQTNGEWDEEMLDNPHEISESEYTSIKVYEVPMDEQDEDTKLITYKEYIDRMEREGDTEPKHFTTEY